MDLQPLVDNLTATKEQIVEKKDNMVLGLLSAVAACPAIIGTTEAVRQGQKKNAKEKHRSQKSNLVVHCSAKSSKRAQIDDGLVVLRNNKVCFPSCSYTYSAFVSFWMMLIFSRASTALHRRPSRRGSRIRETILPPVRRLLHEAPAIQLGLARRRAGLNHHGRPPTAKLDIRRRRDARGEIRQQGRVGRPSYGTLGLHQNRSPDAV